RCVELLQPVKNASAMTRVAFLVNGDEKSMMAHRAQTLASHLQTRLDIQILYRSRRKIFSILRFLAALVRWRPEVCYIFDMSYSGVLAGGIYRLLARNRLVIETGDAITELARSVGRGWVGVQLTTLLVSYSFRAADQIVVRGTFHRDWL